MPQPLKPDRPVKLHVALPESEKARLMLHLWSDLEGRVPQGAYQRFFIERIHEGLEWARLDLERFGFPAGFFVKGPPAMVEALALTLETK